jgi:alkanesulfonate monooxygenase SsuD/methylene tetrahydromethanopterin reductase-like flavin-dependent oxidoreductase (luciferase family)
MPVSSSGVMLGTYRLPNGVGIARPPANSWPPGVVWQATQSPARARYSPLVMTWVVALGGEASMGAGSMPGRVR